jgi:signal transduction histidine kinase/ActR/RegA family two-component response regulator
MLDAPTDKTDERILILVPTPKDAEATAQILEGAGLSGRICESLMEVCHLANKGAGAALLTEEAIAGDHGGCLAQFLRNQPKWSDFPLVVLTRGGLDPRTSFADLKAVGRMTLVPRPVQIAGLVSTLEAAVRDRRRQYALRDHLVERDHVEERLRDADRRKDEFLAMLAHELRNPLAAVRTATTLLRDGKLGEEERQWMLQVLDRQVTQLNRLIDDLLDVSRVTRGKIKLKKQRIAVTEIVDRAVQVVQPLLDSSRHQLQVQGPADGEVLWLDADPSRLEQVVVNLLTNAAKYTPAGGHLWLTYQRHDHQLCLCVRDDGVGIADDMLKRIFEMFTQVRHSLDRSEGGLGIGLTVVQRLVQMHGGTVEARSEGEGRGSEFLVCLPLAEAPTEVAAIPVIARANNTDKRVLVVDDNRDSATTLALLLSRAGYQTDVAYDGLSALERAQAFHPDIALLDIGLPGIDGYELASRLRLDSTMADTLLVAVSGYGQPDDRRRSQEAGFHHHLVKPVDPQQLLELLATQGASST